MSINLSVPAGPTGPELKPKLTVIGIGGAGGNAVNNMIRRELGGVDFVVANTDAQALEQSQAEARIQLGVNLTQGLGAGSQPEIGRRAAEEAIDEVLAALGGSHMAFIAAGMGGGTGTGAAPAIAQAAKEAGILTVAVVTKPFQFEGAHRMRLAESGIRELEQYVDTLIIIPNQNLFRVATENTTFADAFGMADEVLYSGVRGVTDLMVMPGLINLDFADIRSVMSEMGKAMMGTGEAEGERRALDAAEAAIANPLLDDTSMKGANGVLINITGGPDITLFEVDEAASRIRAEVDQDAYIIIGSAFDNDLQGKMRVSVVATGIDAIEKTMPQPTVLHMTDTAAQLRSVPINPDINRTKEKSSETMENDHIFSESETPLDRLVREAQNNDGAARENIVKMELEGKVDPEVDLNCEESEVSNDENSASAGLDLENAEANIETIPAGMPGRNTDETFIPIPAETTAEQELVVDKNSLVTDSHDGNQTTPDSEIASKTSDDDDRPSLFERVTRTGRAAIGRVVPDGTSNSQVGAADIIEATTFGPADEISGLGISNKSRDSANGAEEIEVGVETVANLEELPEEEDLLDIPAFLRRQAN